MKEKLAKALEEILKYVQQGAEFAKEQAPIDYVIWVCFFALAFILSVRCWVNW